MFEEQTFKCVENSVSSVVCLGNMNKDIDVQLQRYSKINFIIKNGINMSIDTKLLVPSHNITPRAPLNYGSVT
jgi:hypothetical protein